MCEAALMPDEKVLARGVNLVRFCLIDAEPLLRNGNLIGLMGVTLRELMEISAL